MRITIDESKTGDLTTAEVFYLARLVADDAEYHPIEIKDHHTPGGQTIGTLSIESEGV